MINIRMQKICSENIDKPLEYIFRTSINKKRFLRKRKRLMKFLKFFQKKDLFLDILKHSKVWHDDPI